MNLCVLERAQPPRPQNVRNPWLRFCLRISIPIGGRSARPARFADLNPMSGLCPVPDLSMLKPAPLPPCTHGGVSRKQGGKLDRGCLVDATTPRGAREALQQPRQRVEERRDATLGNDRATPVR